METINLLLVEDNEMNQFITGTYLRKWGVKVTIANNGQEAIALVQSQKFDVILMDLQMPVMDGFESTRAIRSLNDPYFRSVPIIAFTASTLIDSKEKAVEFGMVDFITKPFNPTDLQEKINCYAKCAIGLTMSTVQCSL